MLKNSCRGENSYNFGKIFYQNNSILLPNCRTRRTSQINLRSLRQRILASLLPPSCTFANLFSPHPLFNCLRLDELGVQSLGNLTHWKSFACPTSAANNKTKPNTPLCLSVTAHRRPRTKGCASPPYSAKVLSPLHLLLSGLVQTLVSS